jgi:transposase-like protein
MSRKRKKHTEEMKARVALEAIKGVRTLSELGATYGVHPTVIAQWKRQLVRGASEVFRRGNAARTEEELTSPENFKIDVALIAQPRFPDTE